MEISDEEMSEEAKNQEEIRRNEIRMNLTNKTKFIISDDLIKSLKTDVERVGYSIHVEI